MGRRLRLGDIFKIPLTDKMFGYAEILKSPEVGFYDYFSEDDPLLDKLKNIPFIFRIWVMRYAFSKNSSWTYIGNVSRDASFYIPSKYFIEDAINGKLSIYQDDPSGSGKSLMTPATFDEAAKLERAAAWDPEHVEGRLRDQLNGAENAWVELLKLKRHSARRTGL